MSLKFVHTQVKRDVTSHLHNFFFSFLFKCKGLTSKLSPWLQIKDNLMVDQA